MRKRLYGIFVLAIAAVAGACSISTAKLADLKTGKDKDTTETATSFKAGDTIYATAGVANNPGKVTVKMYIVVDDAPGMSKGSTIPNSQVSLDIDGDGTARYNYPTLTTTKGGKFMIVADMLDENGQKKDTKSTSVTVEPGATPAIPADDRSSSKDEDSNKRSSRSSDSGRARARPFYSSAEMFVSSVLI